MDLRPPTKEALARALQDLSREKSVAKISVREIAGRAGVTPVTFYNHFSGKYALMVWICRRDIAPCLQGLLAGITWREAVCGFAAALRRSPEFYRNALRNTSGAHSFHYAANNYAIGVVAERMRLRHGASAVGEETLFYVKYYMRLIAEAVSDWFLGGEAVELDILVDRLEACMPASLRPLLEPCSGGGLPEPAGFGHAGPAELRLGKGREKHEDTGCQALRERLYPGTVPHGR